MIWLILIGVAAGVLGGLLGVGGGVLFVPGLVIVLGLDPARGRGDIAAGDRARGGGGGAEPGPLRQRAS